MISLRDFQKEVDFRFWNVAKKKTKYKDIINFNDLDKKQILKEIVEDINKADYNFSTPLYYYSAKKNGILRRIKIYNIRDLAVYYYCVKKIQDELTEKIKKIETAFGGFKFSADNRVLSSDSNNDIPIDNEMEYFDSYQSLISKESFIKEWKGYQQLAYEALDNGYKYYIHIDISHFYDDINLDILEKHVRNIVRDKREIIDLLFYFLRLSDKKDLGYSTASVGIPQEELGEMSRVLANFYLSYYDEAIVSFLNSYLGTGNYLYFRYSDDMWFCFNEDKSVAFRIIQQVSILLNKIKLHINDSKIKIYNSIEFEEYWYFNEWSRMVNNKKSFRYLKSLYDHFNIESNRTGRWLSIAKYGLKVFTSNDMNTRYFRKYDYAKVFVLKIIDKPAIIESFEEKHITFFIELIHRFPHLKQVLIKFLNSKDNIYPTVEFFILNILIELRPTKTTTDFMLNMFTKKFNKSSTDWYSRCLCIRYFIKYKHVTTNNGIKDKLIILIGKNKDYIENEIERRTYIFFFNNFNSSEKKLCASIFNKNNDFIFRSYLDKVGFNR
ncbi:hypothetical protein E2R55_16345 [Vibrio vulnificus]|nr:hypothetical protein E2R55_16345 [Vibrio vulnificus]